MDSSVTSRHAFADKRVPSVDHAMSLFELLANSRQGLTFSELKHELNIPKSTTYYLIHTLVRRGYIECSIDGRHYFLGLRLADIATPRGFLYSHQKSSQAASESPKSVVDK